MDSGFLFQQPFSRCFVARHLCKKGRALQWLAEYITDDIPICIWYFDLYSSKLLAVLRLQVFAQKTWGEGGFPAFLQ